MLIVAILLHQHCSLGVGMRSTDCHSGSSNVIVGTARQVFFSYPAIQTDKQKQPPWPTARLQYSVSNWGTGNFN